MPTVYAQMLQAGIPIDHHGSDLYAKVTKESRQIVNSYPYREQVRLFRHNLTRDLWFDIPFGFDPFWIKRGLPPFQF